MKSLESHRYRGENKDPQEKLHFSLLLVFAEKFHTVALTKTGALYAWELNNARQLKRGNLNNKHEPTAVPMDVFDSR